MAGIVAVLPKKNVGEENERKDMHTVQCGNPEDEERSVVITDSNVCPWRSCVSGGTYRGWVMNVLNVDAL